MSVYRPTYTDPKTGKKKQARLWWYHFTFAGRHIQEPTKTALKTKAKEIEKARRDELENRHGGVTDKRIERVRTIAQIAAAFRIGHKVRRPKSYTSLDYALRHVERILGKRLVVDISPEIVKDYQTKRLEEKAAPKTINEEVSRLLQILGKDGALIRAELKHEGALNLQQTGPQVAQAFSTEQKAAMLKEAKARPKSRAIYPALALNLHAGMRDAEIRDIQWKRFRPSAWHRDRGRSEERSGRRSHDPAQCGCARGADRILEMVSGSVRRHGARLVCFPVRQGAGQ